MHDLSRTIVAVATPPGRGGVGCLRISGPEAVELGSALFARPLPPAGGAPRFGDLLDREGRAVDHGYAVRFAAERSFTGEPTVELWPHGSPPVLAALVRAAVEGGAAPAEPGEFTYRALSHGRLDLARAEAIRELVEARTLYQARVAHAQSRGAVARRVAPLGAALEELVARLEAAVEFVDEADTALEDRRILELAAAAESSVAALVAEFERGRVVRRGATVAILGAPNAGKSSLFNALLGRDRAIVTDTPGTTRDTLEGELDLDGIPLTLIDTAGLRDSDDPIERAGIERAHGARAEADLLLHVVDPAGPPQPELAGPVPTIRVHSKADLRSHGSAELDVSARTGAGLDALRERLRERIGAGEGGEDPVLTIERHGAALRDVAARLADGRRARDEGLPDELVLEDYKRARAALDAITGAFTDEDLYDRVFSTFCIGK